MAKAYIIIFTLFVQFVLLEEALGTSFKSCELNVEVISSSSKSETSGTSIEMKADFMATKVSKQSPDNCCKDLVGKKLSKTLQFKSKQFLPFIKKGSQLTLDYSHFIVDKNDPSMNMEVWKVVNIKTIRTDHDDL